MIKQSKYLVSFLIFFTFSCSTGEKKSDTYANLKDFKVWSREKAQDWHRETGWLVGCNFIPSSAINQLEMWQEETFDPETIDRELGWAEDLGFNSVRVFLHDLMWVQDSTGFLKRIHHFLTLAEEHNISVMVVLFDGVWHPDPRLGKQPDPIPHLHNSGWVQSPGRAVLEDYTQHERLEKYVKGVIRAFANDKRVQVWDIFNEPDNPNVRSYGHIETDSKGQLSLQLLKKSFRWAREVNPEQPITSGVWRGDYSNRNRLAPMDSFMIFNSDIISFHQYDGPEKFKKTVKALQQYQRPLLCTEYMARGNGSTFADILPIMKENEIGAYNWGFVAGRSQTIYPWDSWSKKYTTEPELWFHDIFRTDGAPYRRDEVALIKKLTEQKDLVEADR